MKRAKYSVEIRANVFDEVGSVAGNVETGEKDSLSAIGDHGGAVLDLQRELKAAYQRWLDASDEELNDGVARAMNGLTAKRTLSCVHRSKLKRAEAPTQEMLKAVALRNKGMLYREIGDALGITHQRAWRLVKRCYELPEAGNGDQ